MWRPLPVLLLTFAGFQLAACVQEADPASGGATAPSATSGGATPQVPVPASEPSRYVGRTVCAQCHAREAGLHAGSHHDLAMQEVTPDTVLGDFGDTSFEHLGVTSTFRRDGGRYLVTTEGPDGQPAEYELAYVFGVTPLQQYLVRFPGGRLQALPLCWDTRPAEQGGQRWFHVYGDEPVPAGDELHWTGRNQTWNFMCAGCHSTGLRRGYDPANDAYDTRYEELDVSCEACHGPGSGHVTWVQQRFGGRDDGDPAKGFARALVEHDDGVWRTDPDTGLPRRVPAREGHVEVDTCATCHARRRELVDGHDAGTPFLDGFVPALVEDPLYFADGQIRDEVYVWGSFTQSRMYAAGVSCKDCHDPHSLELRAPGDALCVQCHDGARYKAEAHHHHAQDSAGARCVACHMPTRTYMVVDERRDHHFRVPRPDLSRLAGSPDACSACHTDHDAGWAAEALREWGVTFEDERSQRAAAPTLANLAASAGDPRSASWLQLVTADPDLSAMARASAAAQLGARLDAAGLQVLNQALGDPDPLVRLAAAGSLEPLPPAQRLQVLRDLMDDPVRAVRARVGRLLAAVPASALRPEERAAHAAAVEDALAAERANLERPGAWVNLGVIELDRGRFDAAEAAFRSALRLEPRFAEARVDLADLMRQRGDEEAVRAVLREGLDIAPRNPHLLHALGLALVRAGDLEAAVRELGQAVAWAPGEARYAYVHAVGLLELQRSEEALVALERALTSHPTDADLLGLTATTLRDAGRPAEALEVARVLAERLPGDRGVATLVQELEAAVSRGR